MMLRRSPSDSYDMWRGKEMCTKVFAPSCFAAQMIATNNFNSVLKIDVDQRLLPIVGEFKPATWRKDIK